MNLSLAKYLPLMNSNLKDIPAETVVSMLKDLGIAKNAKADQVEAVRNALTNANVETLGQLATRPELLEVVKGVFTPKDGRPVQEGNSLTGSVIHQCGHCKMFNKVPFVVELG